MEAGEGRGLTLLFQCWGNVCLNNQLNVRVTCWLAATPDIMGHLEIIEQFENRSEQENELLSYWLLFICFRKMTVGLLSNLKTTTSNTGELPQHLRVPQVILIIEYSLENIYKCHTPTQWAVITGLTSNWASHPPPGQIQLKQTWTNKYSKILKIVCDFQEFIGGVRYVSDWATKYTGHYARSLSWALCWWL